MVKNGDIDVVYAREPIDHHGLGTASLLEEPRDALLSTADPLSLQPTVKLVELASRRLLQDPGTVPEWYAVADAAQRRASTGKTVSTVEEKLELVAAHEGSRCCRGRRRSSTAGPTCGSSRSRTSAPAA